MTLNCQIMGKANS